METTLGLIGRIAQCENSLRARRVSTDRPCAGSHRLKARWNVSALRGSSLDWVIQICFSKVLRESKYVLAAPLPSATDARLSQFEQVAHFRNLKPYALVQPHFETISPVLVDSMKTIDAALDCFQQTRETVLRLTREYTLPKLVVENKMSIIKQIADASHTTISCMLVEPATASAILAYIYMRPDREMRAGLTNFMREASKSSLGDQVTLFALLASVRIPLVYRLALLLGDQDPSISTQVSLPTFVSLRKLLIARRRLNALSGPSNEPVIRQTHKLRLISA